MNKTTFAVPKMDCTAEERLIRMTLDTRPGVRRIDADVVTRELIVLHEGDAGDLAATLAKLNLGARVLHTTAASELDAVSLPQNASDEAQSLKLVLAINAGMFVAELAGAYLADSSALLADSLDMFADATVYAIALFGVHRAHASQLRAARLTGLLQLLLAVGAFAEVVRRVIFGNQPEAPLMAFVAAAALIANVTSLWLLARHRRGGAHMKASWICTTTDVVANIGVITAAALVALLQSQIPDLVAATLIAFVVLSGAVRILRLQG